MQFDLKRAQDLLLAQVGKPYIFGHEVKLDDPSPAAFDCSELVQWIFKQMGFSRIEMPDGSWNQWDASKVITTPRPFDLGFLRRQQSGAVFHVAIRFDDEHVIHAKSTADGVVKETIARFESNLTFAGWRRPTCLMSLTF